MALVYVLPKLALLFREDDLLSLSFSYPIHTLVGNDGQECLTPLLDSAENSSQVLRCSLGESGGEWIPVCVWPTPFTAHLKLSHFLLIGYTPMQNKKVKKTMYNLKKKKCLSLQLVVRNKRINLYRTSLAQYLNIASFDV